MITILFAVKKGDPDWAEQLITEHPDKIAAAQKWAAANGFDRFRVLEFKENEKPNFIGTINKKG